MIQDINELVNHLYYLTSEDILLWELETGADCKYTATLDGVTFRLNCDLLKRYFFIDKERVDIGKKATRVLCQLILSQRTRNPIEKQSAKLVKVNKMFSELENRSFNSEF